MGGARRRNVKSNNGYVVVKKNGEEEERGTIKEEHNETKEDETKEESSTQETGQSSFPQLFGTKEERSRCGFIISLRLQFYQNLISVQEFLANLKLVDIPLLIFRLVKFMVTLKSNKKHNYRCLTPSAWTCFFFVCVLTYATRMASIAEPKWVCWDETHFGKFANHYLNGTFFLDVHPPLGKMSIAFAGWLTGYNGTFAFDKPGQEFGEYSYVGMRMYCATLGGLCVPLAYLTVWELTQSLPASLLSASFILFDTGCTTLSRYILLDPILMFFVMCSLYSVVMFQSWQDCPFSFEWWGWMICTGVSIGCAFSVKWVGLFVILFVGVSTVQDLWALIGDISLSVKDLAKHFFARVCGLIVVPVLVYLMFFALHFKVLSHTGSGDYAFSSVFQSTLIGNRLYDAKVPPDVAYGAVISLKNYGIGGTYLHSHHSLYPKEHPAEQQQVTGYGHSDDNNNWRVHKPDIPLDDTYPLQRLRDGDVVRLMHSGTSRNLHSHHEKAPMTPSLMQVTGYGEGDTAVGDTNDNWRVQIVKNAGIDGIIHAVKTVFRLIHNNSGCALTQTGKKLPKWGFDQNEIACNPLINGPGTTWNVENNIHQQIPAVGIDLLAPGFLEKVYESHMIMLETNSGFKPDENEFNSLPWHWPIVYRGQAFSGADYRVYLLGNPVIWWLILATFGVFVVYYLAAEIRNKRKYEIDEKTKEKSQLVSGTCAWFLLGWSLHYFPFYFMGRVLYYHHYFPSYLISAMVSGIVLEHLIHLGSSLFSDADMRKKIYHIGIGFLLFVAIVSFYAFRGLTYGMSGPMADAANATQAAYKWLDTWEL